ncbi:ribose-5-phosphate isomerase RpiA [Weissella soli]|jgi:ribose 5-phosphate isomerase A|uniref:Ribose-5-phosphate isomerase A n=1 Tax=Weissella soli TaxID=155866 RepID=A0A288QKN1_9LACO|nr:ribose-5-phosphate isomerase RpiA [Weissella soli]AOT55666.1 Ribose-5-phosphate isomerase [Weissella soli]NKY83793.1 ribose-5-phosphate isomerase RpiA [Weissella soli]RDL06660.1 ribose-5-phosphate isomerase [Weissella soli]GEN93288.1 ribose-5-phosphate isomerase A [Weissella soli]
MTTDELKKAAGYYAANLVTNNMVVGIGSGSTIAYVIEALGKRVAEEGLQIIGVATSDKTRRTAAHLGIPIYNVDDVDHIDLTIDGADEIDQAFAAIKGGGAALLWEKIVAINSTKNVWVVDETKLSPKLTHFLPVEVIPYGSDQVFRRFENRGYHPTWRLDQNGNPVRTDSANYLIDLHLDHIEDPFVLGRELTSMVGVVEHGLFLDIVDEVIVGRPDGIEVFNAHPEPLI